MKRIFNSDNQSLVETFTANQKEQMIAKYENLGYEVSEDHDGDLVICMEDED